MTGASPRSCSTRSTSSLHVSSVIEKVRIAPPLGRGEKDLQAVPGRRASQPRSDRGLAGAPAKQRPFELANESGAEPSHGVEP